MDLTANDQLINDIKNLLIEAEMNDEIISVTPCLHGGNNRTYKIVTETKTLAVKQYFRQKEDKRDRLQAEFAFLTYAHAIVPNAVPKPYIADHVHGYALYEFVDGSALHNVPLTRDDVKQAASFFAKINQANHRMRAHHLPDASEACFSISTHIKTVNDRIQKLQTIADASVTEANVRELIDHLQLISQLVSHEIIERALTAKINVEATLDASARCISPSDFGFHNALRTTDGRLHFLDFEYAGWDDIAKMIGDFFAQLAIPVPVQYFDDFLKIVSAPFEEKDLLKQRSLLLLPLYQLKWCCIALNIFIPVHLERRRFANPQLDVQQLKRMQLLKAENILKKLETRSWLI